MAPGRLALGAGLLAIAFLLGCTCLFWHNFIDEGDNIAVGVLVAQGKLLYRDVFSHHFPFAYYWVALVSLLCGPSILALRASVLVFQTAAFGLAMWLTPFPAALGLAALAWRAIAPPYYGNMVIYHNLMGAALIPVFAVTVAVAGRRIVAGRREVLAMGACAAIAVLCDPLALYPVALCFLVLALCGGFRAASLGASLAAGLLAAGAGFLLLSGTLGEFVAQTIRFNSEVYGKYTPVHPVPVSEMARIGMHGLSLFDARWLRVSSLLESYRWPDRFLLTGFFYRAAVIFGVIALLLQRRFTAGAFLYVLAALELAAFGEERFRAIPFILTALLVAAACVTGEWQREEKMPAAGHQRPAPRRVLRAAVPLARIVVALALLGLIAEGAVAICENRRWLSYEANFRRYERQAERLAVLRCGRTDVALGRYPSDPLLHVFSGMPPASKYVFLLPWVADVGMEDVIGDLRREKAIVVIDAEGEVWGRKNAEYLAPLLGFLKAEYHRVEKGVYVSPSLAAVCPAVN